MKKVLLLCMVLGCGLVSFDALAVSAVKARGQGPKIAKNEFRRFLDACPNDAPYIKKGFSGKKKTVDWEKSYPFIGYLLDLANKNKCFDIVSYIKGLVNQFLYEAIVQGKTVDAERLIEIADVNAEIGFNASESIWAAGYRGKKKKNFLHLAVEHDLTGLILPLASKMSKESINSKDYAGRTPLDIAVERVRLGRCRSNDIVDALRKIIGKSDDAELKDGKQRAGREQVKNQFQ